MKFGIKDLERLSGIKAHTIRTWEHRYGMPKPYCRTGKTRCYCLDEVKLVLDIALLNNNGYKISVLARLSKEEITQRVKALRSDDDNYLKVINELFRLMYKMEVRDFESVLDHCFITWPSRIVIQEIIVPFLKKTNLFWKGKQLTEEHLVVTILRKKFLSAIEKIDVPLKEDRKIVLFLTNARQLDLALLYASYYIRYMGIEVIYMGNDVSIDNLEMVFDTIKPDFLYTYFPRKSGFSFDKVAWLLDHKLPGANLVVTIHPDKTYRANISKRISFMQFDQALPFLCK
jgi:DNA-binding transcriptional MerR regulator